MALSRSLSPTRQLWDNRASAQLKISQMASMGLHVFSPEWGNQYHSPSFTECTMKVYGSDETITIPVQTCTKVQDVRHALAAKAMVNPDDLIFVHKQGCSWRVLQDVNEVARNVTVRGIKSFEPQPVKWPHPTVMLGAGYNGISNALLYLHHGCTNFIMYDRYDRVGGHAWITQANKTSKLQTEMGSFHVWFGTEWGDPKQNSRLHYPVEWDTWPKKDQILAHMQHACDRYGIIPYIRFRTNVTACDVVGKLTDWDRFYQLTAESLDGERATHQVTASNVYHWPGAYFQTRIIEYPGEDIFDGHIGYGMNDDIPFDYLEGSNTAILGNGAFAVENIRTCMEYGTKKVYLVTRRKNLPSPRLPCWFVHQALIPVPAQMVLSHFSPMYAATGFGDPWEYHSVYGSKDRTKCTVVSNSRFGIGDVTFLAVAWGRCEYVVDLLKRCTRHTLHLEGGRKLHDVTNIIKCLGLIGDFQCDKLHKIKEMVGIWPHADYRRMIFCDPLGMNAANFAAFSTGIGSYDGQVKQKYLLDFPHEWARIMAAGVLDMLPRTKLVEGAKPAHQYDAKYAQTSAVIVEGACPTMSMKMAGVDEYFFRMMWEVNPLDRYLKECKDSWDQYQDDWRRQGFDHEWVEYPYTFEMVLGWMEEFRRTVGWTSIEEKKMWEEAQKQNSADGGSLQWNSQAAKDWWKSNCTSGSYFWAARRDTH